ncbi:PfkB family carbohydrate kinase [Amnibacterium sp. CER49]|uniref:PfkB family carbohydrate kinase n=1 Tax=Amnibacterium sp. CER49 TaxID=3039161 RepID=UPI0024475D27|nr:PfkB family carbohydrate kinase [Amnibacterium sp. CER49]MDH2445394.1 PfkB family carbohydrate kinase [Amnibacterium sp. CER49]
MTAITVVGDALLDVDLVGDVERLSPEAPVPVVDIAEQVRRAGGAGLVATLLARDGHRVRLVTALGDDESAERLRETLDGVDVVAGPSNAPTAVKTRLRTAAHAIARIDEGSGRPPVPEVTHAMLDAVRTAEVVLVADYGRRLTEHPALREALTEAAARVPVVWDPHPRGTDPVPGVAVVTPNLGEARVAAELAGSGVPVADEAALRLRERWAAQAVVVTMGEHGALLRGSATGLPFVAQAPAVENADTCGAGDRFAASLAVSVAGGAPVSDAVLTAVQDTAAFLAAGGVASLARPANTTTLAGPDHDAVAVAERVRAAGGTVVATGGCFDLLHAGHARTLSAARGLGDCLIVLLNSDRSVRELKGPERPIIQEADRVDLLLALEVVDAVLVFDESTPVEAIRRIQPDIWVKGGDYSAADLPEAAVIQEWGGRAVTVPFHPGRSTTRLAAALAAVG